MKKMKNPLLTGYARFVLFVEIKKTEKTVDN